MPPKKKKGSKKSGKKGKKSAKDINVEEVELDEPELNREFFIFHIKDLERKLKLYRNKVRKLQEQNREYMEKQFELNKDKKDTIESLKKNLLNRGDELSDRKDRFKGLYQAKETEKMRYEAKLQEIQSQLQETKDKLTSQNNSLSAQLAALQEFELQKEKYLEEYTELENLLEQKKQNHDEKLQKIQDKESRDRDRLKKEIVNKINVVAADFRKVSQKQTSETTKRTIRENVSIASQLTKMDDKNLELTQENENMQQKIRENRAKLKELKDLHNELASKNSSHRKLIHMLMNKHQEYYEMGELYQAEEHLLNKINQETIHLTQMNKQQQQISQDLYHNNESIQETNSQLEEELKQIEEQIDEAKKALIESVKQLKELLQVSKPIKRVQSRTSRSNRKSLVGSLQESGASVETKLSKTENEMIMEWGDLEQRFLAEQKLQKLLDALDYCEDSEVFETESVEESKPDSRHITAASPSISLTSKRLKSATSGKRTPESFLDVSILSDHEIRRQAKLMLQKQKNGICVPGLLEMVPSMSRHIPTNQEKSQLLNKRLIGLDKYQNENEIELPIRNNALKPSKEARMRFLAG